jgi:hypothetical protein
MNVCFAHILFSPWEILSCLRLLRSRGIAKMEVNRNE